MPNICRKPIREKKIPYKSERKEENAKFYGSPAWKILRKAYTLEHPICEICMKYKHVTPVDDVHHRIPFFTGATDETRWNLFLEEKNLISVCRTCHLALHEKGAKYNLTCIDDLTETEYNRAHNYETN